VGSGKSLMSAVVRIRPDLDAFRSDLKRGVSTAAGEAGGTLEQEIGQAGRSGGRAAGEGIADGVQRGTSEAKRELQSLEDRAKKMGDSFGRMQGFGAKMSMAVTAPLMALGTMAVRTFSSYEDARDAAAIFFGDQISHLETLEGKAATSLGLARDEVYNYANAFAPLLQQFTNADQLGGRAVDTIARAADAASMFGTSTERAAGAFSSFLSGSSAEPIRAYGVFLSEASVAAIAVREGLVSAEVDTAKLATTQARLASAQQRVVKLTREGKRGSVEYQSAQAAVLSAETSLVEVMEGKIPQMTDSQKLQARYIGLMEQTAVVEGNFAQTADSTANSMKTTQKEVRNAAISAGEELAPAVKEAASSLTGLLQAFNGLPEGTRKMIVYGAAVSALVGPMLSIVGTVGKVGASLVGLAAKWFGVKVAADSATVSQTRASAAGMAAGGGRGVAGAARMAAGGKLAIGAAALAGGYMLGTALNDRLDLSGRIGNRINGLAEGGTTTTRGTVLVGERGPELLSLPRGAEVRPLDKVGGDTFNISVQVTGRAADDPAALARELDRLARRTAATVGSRRLP
jgi:hypothetical protein